MIQRTPRVVRRVSPGPRNDNEPHRVVKQPRTPPAAKPRVPALDAYQLVRAITRARLLRDWDTADKLLTELRRLAAKPKRHTEGEHREQHG